MKWQNVIAAELRDCDDEEYAAQLLRLLEHERVGFAAPSVLALKLAVYLLVVLFLVVPQLVKTLSLPLMLYGWAPALICGSGLLLVKCARMRWPRWVRMTRWFPFTPTFGGRLRPSRLDFQPSDLERALRQACDLRLPGWEQWQALRQRLEQARRDQVPPAEALNMLDSDQWEERFLARHLLADIGGEAVPQLVAMNRSPVRRNAAAAYRVLRAISRHTEALPLASGGPWHCAEHLLQLSDYAIVAQQPETTLAYGKPWVPRYDLWYRSRRYRVRMRFFRCRVCGQSRHLVGPIVAVLDNQDQEERRQAGSGELRVNWLVRDELFDFERVEIVRATDEQVARFILALGNDADKMRGPAYYGRMACKVFEACSLSENNLRALRSLFGQVLIVPAPGGTASATAFKDKTRQPVSRANKRQKRGLAENG